MPAFPRLRNRPPARLRRPALLCLCVSLLCVSLTARAQSSTTPPPTVRYHLGDNPLWAAPSFDDSAWPIAPQGLVPSRSSDRDRFLWVRIRVPVPASRNAPLALHLTDLGVQPIAWQLFVNGQLLGGQGSFPPHPDPAAPPVSPVIDLPASLAPPGSTALLALREWYAPTFFESRVPSRPTPVIDEARVLRLSVRASDAETLVANGPEYALSALLFLVGIALLFFWRSARAPEYLWAAIYLLSPLFTAILSSGPVTARLSYRQQTLGWALVYSAGLLAEIEFMWNLFRLRTRWLHILWHAIWIVFIAAPLLAEAFFPASPAIDRLCQIVIVAGVAAFDAILFPVCIREMFRPRGNRAIAAAQSLLEVIIALGIFGYSQHLALGPLNLDLFQLTLTLVDLAVAALLMRRAVRAWRQANTLRVEFDSAREVQQRLVTAPPATSGFRIETAYRPATQVGGDFYRVLPGESGDVLIVVGDVSGKGLPAAMTVSAIIGSLRTLPARAPAAILRELNRSLTGNLHGGFVTCLCAHIEQNGTVTVANAGHLAPYCNGDEIKLDPGLPLGLTPDADYTETTLHLAPNDTLTFLSDGVPEARNPSGELYGFDRTQKISTQSAEAIAAAAQAHGQEDDITVLTLAFTGVTLPAAPR